MNTTHQSSLQVSDNEAAAVQKTENRVALKSLEENIDVVEYLYPQHAPHFTLCVLHLKNGYVITGQSAPADPANFNLELGQKFAREDAIRKTWPLAGYALCEKLAAEKAATPTA